MTDEQLKAHTEMRIARPVSEVFEAIVNPVEMTNYFISAGSARMEAGKTVHWEFADAGASFEVKVERVEYARSVAWRGEGNDGETLAEIDLRPDGDSATIVTVSETGWPRDRAGIDQCIGNSKGWVYFLCCMKAYLEFGINLRSGGVVAGRL